MGLDVVVSRWIKGFANYTFQHTWDPDRSMKLPYLATHKGTLGVTVFPVDHLTLNIRTNLVGSRSTALTDPLKSVDGYWQVNISMRVFDIGIKGLSATLNLYNIFNKLYYDPGIRSATGTYYPMEHPQPGFGLNGFLEYRF